MIKSRHQSYITDGGYHIYSLAVVISLGDRSLDLVYFQPNRAKANLQAMWNREAEHIVQRIRRRRGR